VQHRLRPVPLECLLGVEVLAAHGGVPAFEHRRDVIDASPATPALPGRVELADVRDEMLGRRQ
jgi:hypothetical protein